MNNNSSGDAALAATLKAATYKKSGPELEAARTAVSKLYLDEGLPIRTIAKRGNRSFGAIRKALVDSGVPLRRRGPGPAPDPE